MGLEWFVNFAVPPYLVGDDGTLDLRHVGGYSHQPGSQRLGCLLRMSFDDDERKRRILEAKAMGQGPASVESLCVAALITELTLAYHMGVVHMGWGLAFNALVEKSCGLGHPLRRLLAPLSLGCYNALETGCLTLLYRGFLRFVRSGL